MAVLRNSLCIFEEEERLLQVVAGVLNLLQPPWSIWCNTGALHGTVGTTATSTAATTTASTTTATLPITTTDAHVDVLQMHLRGLLVRMVRLTVEIYQHLV